MSVFTYIFFLIVPEYKKWPTNDIFSVLCLQQ